MIWQRIYFVLISWFFICFPFHAETNNRVLLTIGGKPVSVDEFNLCYSRFSSGSHISAERFFDHFLLYKLKAFDARNHGWDTVPDIRIQCDLLKGKVLKHYMTDPAKADAFHLSCYRKGFSRMCDDNWVKVEHISVFLPQHASPAQERAAWEKINSVYQSLKQGISFDDLYRKYEDVRSDSYLKDVWMPQSALIKEFADKLQTLEIGGISAPFYSPLGIHIVRLVGRKSGVSYEEALLKIRGMDECKYDCMKLVDYGCFYDWKQGSQALSPEILAKMELAEDGLLAAYWDESYETDKRNVSSDELMQYFKDNEERYRWKLPHFKGGVVHCLNKKSASRLKKKLKKLPYDLWKQAIKELSSEDKTLVAEVETGVFRIGSNVYVDKLAFKCGSFNPDPKFTYTFVIGKRLKKGPENYTDVQDEVLNDYLAEINRQRLEELLGKYSVEINQEVLKTVNYSGSK